MVAQARRDSNGDGEIWAHVDRAATRGDELALYFIDAPGPGSPIDAFGGASRDGRWVVLARDGHWHLRDTFSGDEVRLGRFETGMPNARVTADGRRSAYVVRQDAATELRRRSVDTGVEHRVELPPGTLQDLALDPTGAIAAIVIDGGGAGPTLYVAQIETGSVTQVEGRAVWLLAGRAITTAEDNALIDAVTRAVVVPSSCSAQVLATSESTDRLWVACRRDRRGERDADGKFESLGLAWFGVDGASGTLPSRVRLDHGFALDAGLIRTSDEQLVDPDSGAIGRSLCNPVVAHVGARIFCIEDEAFVHDLAQGERRVLSKASFSAAEASAQNGPLVAVVLGDGDHLVVDIERPAVRGRVPSPVCCLTESGLALVPELGNERFGVLMRGPMHWVEPDPTQTDPKATGPSLAAVHRNADG